MSDPRVGRITQLSNHPKPLPTPEEMAVQISMDGWSSKYRAILADREAIAQRVEQMQRSVDDKLDEFSDGYRKACAEIVVMVRPTGIICVQNKKGEPPLDDSPTAPLV